MISRLEGWTWDVHGGGVTLSWQRNPGCGVIRYRERLRPLRSLAEVVRDKPAGVDVTITRIGEVTPLMTHEGEFAAAVDLEGTSKEMPVQYSIGVVFADDWYSELVAVAHGRAQFSMFAGTMRELLRGDQLMLGVRRRRYSYKPPAGWSGYSRLPMFATWFPPEFPSSPTSITMYPAIPATQHGELNIAHLRLGPVAPAQILGELSPRSDVQMESGLVGSGWNFAIRDEAGRDLVRRVIMLRDERYIYASHLDARPSDIDRWIATWKELVESIQPLPLAKTSEIAVDVFQHLY